MTPWHWWAFAVLGLLYVGLYYGAPVSNAPPPNLEPRSSPKPIAVAGTLILAVLGFVLFDAVIFHTALYSSMLSPKSFAGYVHLVVTRERERPVAAARNVLVMGDSRMSEGFSARQAGAIAGPGWQFVNASVVGSAVRPWYYMLREIDPRRDRYAAIVLPVEYSDAEPRAPMPDQPQDYFDRKRDISLSSPCLRYTDAFTFAASFSSWPNRCRAFAVCLLRGFGYQSDVIDFFEHPSIRLKRLRQVDKLLAAKASYAGRRTNLLNVAYNPETQTLTIPPGFPPAETEMLKQSLAPRTALGGARWVAYRQRWVGAILRAYKDSKTRIVLMQLPRGPFVPPTRSPAQEPSTLGSLVEDDKTIVLDREQFVGLEKPDFFFDALHPNAAGQKKITEALTQELLQRLQGEQAPAQPSAQQ